MNMLEICKEFLDSEGFPCEMNTEKGRLAFRAQGIHMLLFWDSGDSDFLKISAFWPGKDMAASESTIRETLNRINADRKVVKAIFDSDGDIELTCELLMRKGADSRADLPDILRSLDMIAQAANYFREF